jgi:hypothetical protein
METVSSGDFIQHEVSVGNKGRYVEHILVHTDPGQDKPAIITADFANNELRTYDLTSWQCVSQCTTPARPMCLYESDGGAYVHCVDGSLYNISSIRPLTISTSPHGHVTGVKYYDCISHLGPGRLVAVFKLIPAVHVIDLYGRQLADLTTCGGYRFTDPCSVVCGGGRVVVTGEGKGCCRSRVVCMEESAGSWSVRWMHDVVGGYTRIPVITPGGGTVIVPCQGYPDCIVSLSLETGAVLQEVDVAPGCPVLGRGTCVYGESLQVGCGQEVVVEFSLQGIKDWYVTMLLLLLLLLLLLFNREHKLIKHQSLFN